MKTESLQSNFTQMVIKLLLPFFHCSHTNNHRGRNPTNMTKAQVVKNRNVVCGCLILMLGFSNYLLLRHFRPVGPILLIYLHILETPTFWSLSVFQLKRLIWIVLKSWLLDKNIRLFFHPYFKIKILNWVSGAKTTSLQLPIFSLINNKTHTYFGSKRPHQDGLKI